MVQGLGISEAARELEVPSALNNLSFAIEKLQGVVAGIGDRVSRAMRNEPPTQPVDGKTKTYATPLAEDIRGRAEQILDQVDILKSYLDRLEI